MKQIASNNLLETSENTPRKPDDCSNSVAFRGLILFVLYFICITLPVPGLILGFQVAALKQPQAKNLAHGLIYYACVSFICQICIALAVGLVLFS